MNYDKDQLWPEQWRVTGLVFEKSFIFRSFQSFKAILAYNYQHAINEAEDALRILASRSGKRSHLNISLLSELLKLTSRKTFGRTWAEKAKYL